MAQRSPEHRHFTVAEANALLPTLENMLRRLQNVLEQARTCYREMEMIKAVGYTEDGTLIMLHDYRTAKEQFEATVAEANKLVEEINGFGCQIKSIDMGLVDFPAIINGEEVLLCWKIGEDAVAHFHSWEGGYNGRRPLTADDDDTSFLGH